MKLWIFLLSVSVYLAQKAESLEDVKDVLMGQKGRLLPIALKTISPNTFYSVVVSTVPPTCIVGLISTSSCAPGKRRRRSVALLRNIDGTDIESSLSSNVDTKEIDSSMTTGAGVDGNQREKLLFGLTIWKTSSITSTVTTITTGGATTVSLSFVCWAPGWLVPPLCG